MPLTKSGAFFYLSNHQYSLTDELEAFETEILQALYDGYKKDTNAWWDISAIPEKHKLPPAGVFRHMEIHEMIKVQRSGKKELCAIRMAGIARLDELYVCNLINRILDRARTGAPRIHIMETLGLPANQRNMANELARFMFEMGIATAVDPARFSPVQGDIDVTIASYYTGRHFSFDNL